jgi:hypothetical protein
VISPTQDSKRRIFSDAQRFVPVGVVALRNNRTSTSAILRLPEIKINLYVYAMSSRFVDFEEWQGDQLLAAVVAERLESGEEVVPFEEIETRLDRKAKGRK